MHAGLERILDLIRVNPQDTLLVDRFLILAADLHEEDRASVTLGLSEVLLRKNPRRSIELAHMVYKAKPGEPQPLQIMVEGLENLGRYGKATVLRQHLEKVKRAKATSPGSVKKAVEDSMVAIDRELLLLAQPLEKVQKAPAPPPPKLELAPQKLPEPPQISAVPGPALAFSEPMPPRSSFSAQNLGQTVTQMPFFNSEESRVSVLSLDDDDSTSGNHPAVNQKPAVLFEIAPEAAQAVKADLGETDISVARPAFDVLLRSESLSINPKARSYDEGAYVAELLPYRQGIPSMVPASAEVGRERDEENYNQNSILEAEPRQDNTSAVPISYGGRDRADALRQMITDKNWEGVWALLRTHWPHGASGDVYQIAREARLYRIDVNFMTWWLECLLLDRRPRQVLALASQLLREQPHIAVAKAVYLPVRASGAALGLNTLNWREEDGVLNLLKQLSVLNLDTCASIAIFNVRAL